MVKRSLAAGAAAVLLAGCANVDPGPIEHVVKSVDLDRASLVTLNLSMGAGQLHVDGGSPKLVEADLEYGGNMPVPSVRYEAAGERGTITIEQAESDVRNGHNNWMVRVNDGVPMEVGLHIGAGEGRIALGSLDLRDLDVHLGVGDVALDLRGEPRHSYNARIQGGVGQTTVYLPKTVGISATAEHGIGGVHVEGLEQRNGDWVNPGHESSPVMIHVSAKSGIGAIRLIAE